MQGQAYFEKRLGDIYDYSLIKYFSGSGNLISCDTNIPVDWELCVDITGDILLVFTSKTKISQINGEHKFIKFNLQGVSTDENWEINSENIIIYSKQYILEFNNYSYFCTPENFKFTKKSYQEDKIDSVVVFVLLKQFPCILYHLHDI